MPQALAGGFSGRQPVTVGGLGGLGPMMEARTNTRLIRKRRTTRLGPAIGAPRRMGAQPRGGRQTPLRQDLAGATAPPRCQAPSSPGARRRSPLILLNRCNWSKTETGFCTRVPATACASSTARTSRPYPYYANYAHEGDRTFFRHIDVKIKQLANSGRGAT